MPGWLQKVGSKPVDLIDEFSEKPAEQSKPLKYSFNNIRILDGSPDVDLRRLAMERASRVRDRLAGSGKVEPGRIFLVEPKTLPPERKEKLRDSRVDFRIK
jgi:hypothetical protein